MTCVFAMAVPTLAMVVADTRLNVQFRDSATGIHDEGPLDITYPDGKVLSVGSRYRKIRRTSFGWAAGAGAFPLVHAALERLSQPAATAASLSDDMDDLYQDAASTVAAHFPGLADTLEQTAIVIVHSGRGSFQLDGLRFDKKPAVPPGSQFAFLAPPDLPTQNNRNHVERIQRELTVPANLPQLYTNLRLVAEIFRDVHAASSTVSDVVEMGLMLNTGSIEFRHLQRSTGEILHADNEHLSRMFTTET